MSVILFAGKKGKKESFLARCCGILLTPLRWFKQIKRTVSFDVTTRFNAIQQSIAMYNSHILNARNTTINVTKRSTINSTKLKHSKYTVVFLLSLRKAVFYINHMYSKSSHCNVSKLNVYYKIPRSFTLFSLRKSGRTQSMKSMIDGNRWHSMTIDAN